VEQEAVAEQEAAVEQEAPGPEGAVASVRAVAEAAQELELAVAVQEQEPAEAVQELVVGEAVVGQAEGQAGDPAEDLAGGPVAELAKEPRLEDGPLRRQCCAQPRADWAACQAFLAHREKAVAVFRWRKRMFGRCWDCSRNWGSPAKIRMREWTRRLSNPA